MAERVGTAADSPGQARPRVVIIGGGFGGLRLARRLRQSPVDVTVIDQHNYHTFMPLLYEVATAGLSPGDIAQPFRAMLRDARNARFVLGRVSSIDPERRTVVTSAGTFTYDYLAIAAGTITNPFGVEGVGGNALGLKEMPDAIAIRNRILRNFERASVEADPAERARLMTMVVVGGGPTGVEIAGALAELREHVLRRDYPRLNMAEARVILLEAGTELLPAFPPRLRRNARAQLRELGVEVRTEAVVSGVSEGEVSMKTGASIESANVTWVAGTRGTPLAETLGLPLSRDGRIAVTPSLEVIGAEKVYALGDIAYLVAPDGRPYPMLAQVALQQADVVARNIVRDMRGETPVTFGYRDRGVMATIGRRRAVAYVFRLQFGGSLAWVLWLAVHLLAIVSLRNRALVLLNWVWNYFRYDRASRLLTDERHEAELADQNGREADR